MVRYGPLAKATEIYVVNINQDIFKTFACSIHRSQHIKHWKFYSTVWNETLSSVSHPSTRISITWWHHQMETFSTLLAICAVNSPVTGEFPTQRPVTWSFDVFVDLRLNKHLSKQTWGWGFETPLCWLRRHCNEGWANKPGPQVTQPNICGD